MKKKKSYLLNEYLVECERIGKKITFKGLWPEIADSNWVRERHACYNKKIEKPFLFVWHRKFSSAILTNKNKLLYNWKMKLSWRWCKQNIDFDTNWLNRFLGQSQVK